MTLWATVTWIFLAFMMAMNVVTWRASRRTAKAARHLVDLAFDATDRMHLLCRRIALSPTYEIGGIQRVEIAPDTWTELWALMALPTWAETEGRA